MFKPYDWNKEEKLSARYILYLAAITSGQFPEKKQSTDIRKMKHLEVLAGQELVDYTSRFEEDTTNQVVLSLNTDTFHIYDISIVRGRFLIVTNLLYRKEINYYIAITPFFTKKDSERGIGHNRTAFDFGGNDGSVWLFSNLNIVPKITRPFYYDRDTGEQLFMVDESGGIITPDGIETWRIEDLQSEELFLFHLYNESKVTFLNCKFINNTGKAFRIETWHEAIVQFVGCEFEGDFIFSQHHDSKIIQQ